MSDDAKPDETPTPAPEAPPSPAVPSAPEGTLPKPAAPRIEYAMPTQKKAWLPSPAFIRNMGCMLKVCVALTVVLGMGYFALVALNPKARQWATQGAKDGSGGPTPFKAMNQVLAIPAQAMGKTDDVVKANNARVGQLDGLVAEEEKKAHGMTTGSSRPVVDPFAAPAAASPEKSRAAGAAEVAGDSAQSLSSAAILALAEKRAAAGSPLPAPSSPLPVPRPQAPPEPPTPDEMKLAGNIIIAHASPEGSPRASAAFFFWTVKLNVSGITQSKPARLLLNGRLAHEGDEVNHPLGIVFAQLDPANQLIVFRDKTGAIVTRSY